MSDLERGTAVPANNTGTGVLGHGHNTTNTGTGVLGHNHPQDTTATGTGVLGHHEKHRGATTGAYGNDYGNNYGGVSRIANPHPLGILAFGVTLFVYSLYALHARGVRSPNVIVGMALFVGGLAQLLAGMWAFPRGSTFAATIYTLYGAFWMSFALILIPGTGILASFANTTEYNEAIGMFFLLWMAVTVIFLIGSLKRHITFLAFLFALTLFFLLIGVSYLHQSVKVSKAGGAFGIITSLVAFYLGLAKLLESDRRAAIAGLPLGYLGAHDMDRHGRSGGLTGHNNNTTAGTTTGRTTY